MIDRSKLHRALHPLALSGLAGVLALGTAGCKSKTAQIIAADQTGQDPADANMAQPYTGGNAGGYTSGQPTGTGAAPVRVMGQTQSYQAQSSGESFETQQAAPIIRQAPPTQEPEQYYPVPQAQGANASYNDAGQDTGQYPQQAYTQGYNDAEEAGDEAIAETEQAPPPLPEYDQPPAPEDNYIWTPGYWNYASTGYYWVPGVWCAPPFYGALWTPPYWGYDTGHYRFHRGYWGHHVGYYGGVNYGFGYIGTGYFGGYWHNRDFFYNRAVTNVNVTNIHNVYNRTVVYDNRVYGPRSNDRVSYNGGRGGLSIQPRPFEVAAMREAHYAPVPAQRENRLAAAGNRAQFFSVDHGRPANAFRAQPVGAINRIAAAPERPPVNQPGNFGPDGRNNRTPDFNRAGQPNSPAAAPFNNRPSGTANDTINRRGNETPAAVNPNRSGTFAQPNDPRNRPGNFNRPNGTANDTVNRRGNETPAAVNPNRGGTFAQPNDPRNRPGNFNRPGNPNPPNGGVNRPEALNPGSGTNRPENSTRPNVPGQPETNGTRPGEFRNRDNAGPRITPNQPGAVNARPAEPARSATPTIPNPPVNVPRAGNFHRDVPASPQPGGAQPFNRSAPEPSRPQMQQQRPNFEQNRPAPAFTPRPQSQPNMARPAAPAPAPRAESPRPAPAATPHNGGAESHHH